jgi:hypothetical protein
MPKGSDGDRADDAGPELGARRRRVGAASRRTAPPLKMPSAPPTASTRPSVVPNSAGVKSVHAHQVGRHPEHDGVERHRQQREAEEVRGEKAVDGIAGNRAHRAASVLRCAHAAARRLAQACRPQRDEQPGHADDQEGDVPGGEFTEQRQLQRRRLLCERHRPPRRR